MENNTVNRIASFDADHDKIVPGFYLSRVDGDVVTYDIRMKIPNGGDYLDMASAHTFEHLFATYARNSEYAKDIVYVGPMGCRTGFYLLTRDRVSYAKAIALVQDSMRFIRDYQGEIPGASRKECGNYQYHDLAGAKALAKDMAETLRGWTQEKLYYKE